MKKVFLKIKAFLLAIILLIASNTYAVTSHYCGSYLVDVSYLGKAKGCGMEDTSPDVKRSKEFKKRCCSELTQVFESQVESPTIKNYEAYFFEVLVITTEFFQVHPSIVPDRMEDFPKEDSPPDVIFDFQILFETFLI